MDIPARHGRDGVMEWTGFNPFDCAFDVSNLNTNHFLLLKLIEKCGANPALLEVFYQSVLNGLDQPPFQQLACGLGCVAKRLGDFRYAVVCHDVTSLVD